MRNAYCAYALRTAAQSRHVQKRTRYVSIPHTSYPAAIHACSCTLTQKSGYSVCPSESSFAGASDEPDAVPRFEAGSVGPDYTFGGRCTEVRALVDNVRVCAGADARVVDEDGDDDDDDDGGSVEGS